MEVQAAVIGGGGREASGGGGPAARRRALGRVLPGAAIGTGADGGGGGGGWCWCWGRALSDFIFDKIVGDILFFVRREN